MTVCNTPHPDFPDLVCRIVRGDHRDKTHRCETAVGVVEWPMVDTEAEFRRKDADYFALVGRTVMHGPEVAQVIEYKPLRGPAYLFTLQYANGQQVGSQRGEFYVLPTQDELAEWLREIFTAEPAGTPWGVAAEELLLLLKGEVS